jgi:hypothetical protein
MSSADRKRKILDHLNQSVGNSKFLTPKTPPSKSLDIPSAEPEIIQPSPEPPPVPIAATPAEDRQAEHKRRVMTHITQSSGDFGAFSLTTTTDKAKVLKHIQKSLN